MEKIILIIENKIKEHRMEIEGCTSALPNLQTQANMAIEKKKHDVAVYGQKIMILKDKMLFHKACVMTLTDLLKDITNA